MRPQEKKGDHGTNLKRNGGVGLKMLPLVFTREKATGTYQPPLQNVLKIFLGCEAVCPFQTPFCACDGTAQVERPAPEPTWAAAVKPLSNFRTAALETAEKNNV
jgi:hypothetical protein